MSTWSRTVRLVDIPANGLSLAFQAPTERLVELARRLGLDAVESLSVQARLAHQAQGLVLTGTIQARVAQLCVVSREPFRADVSAPLDIAFVPPAQVESYPLDQVGPDVEPLPTGPIDVAEIAVQTLSLALDPYPRAPNADAIAAAVGISREP
jgi:uncharacterized metal-binding protein YceD (DUF177 family)